MVPRSTVTLLLALSLLGLLVSGGDSTADTPSRSLFHEDSPALETIARLQAEPNEFLKGQPSAGLKAGPGWGQQDGLQHQQHNQGTTDATAYHSSERSSEKDSDSPLSFSCTNNYPKVTWSPWSHLAEPYREAKLIADSTVGDPENDIFTWILPSEEGAMREGRILSHVFTSVGKKPVILVQKVVATGEQYTIESFVMVKYIRREVRALHDEDRGLFLDVLEILYRVPTSEGKKIYGEDYKGIDHFVQMHLDGAGTKECDHWHDDAGIVTHHVAYTLLFEQAMQRIAPSISIPYWEYTIEASQDIDNYGESIIFDDNWFGEFNPQNDMHTMERGRFAFLPIMKDAWDYVHNSYGLLRTPWNLNPTPFVTRHNMTNSQVPTSMVSCSEFSGCLNSSTLVVMNECLNGLTHGPVHILTGGQWDNQEEDFIAKTGYYMLAPLITKFLWRKGYIRLPEHCRSDDACVASCPADVYESRGMNEYDVLMDVHALAWMSTLTRGKIAHNSTDGKFYVAGKSGEVQDAFWKKMLRSFCDPGHVGEMYTSAAPYDPLFWVVHPTIDRLLAWRRILAIDYPDTWALDETWGYDHSGFVIGDTGIVCDWSNIEQGSTDLPKCVKGICGGHRESDLLPFLVEINGEVKQYTNAEWMDLVHPHNEDLPYMYDRFNWHHCYEDGYGMGTESSF